MNTVEASTWDRVLAAVAHPMRLLSWSVALGTLLGPIGGSSWVLTAIVAVLVALVVGELSGISRVRLPWLMGVPVFLAFGSAVVRTLSLRFDVLPHLFGAATMLWLAMLAGVALTIFCGVTLLRVLARRGPAYQAVELALIGGLLANAFASHRDGAIARPLWLTDLCWSFGVDPGQVLLGFGALLTVGLVALLLLGAQQRKPGPGLLALPVVALIAWFIATHLPAVEPPDPEKLFAEAGGEEPGQAADGEGDEGEGDEDEGDGGESDKGESDKGEGDKGEGGAGEGDAGEGDAGEGDAREGDAGDGQGEKDPTEQDGTSDGGEAQSGDAAQGEDPAKGSATPAEDGQAQGGSSSKGDGDKNGPSEQAPDPLKGGAGGGASPVAVVLIDDDYVPPGGVWYLRQGELSSYNGSRLVQSSVLGSQADLAAHFPVTQEDLRFQAPSERRSVVHGSVSLLVEHPNPFAPTAAVQYSPRANPAPARFDRSYSFVSHMVDVGVQDMVGLGVGDPSWSDELRAEYLEPPTDPRYLALAEQVRDDFVLKLPPNLQADPLAHAVGITLWLGENMSYSKAEKHEGVPDPTGDFLFGNRIGYCVHSAHASVYLWRSLGIPSRIATGYAVEEDQRRGSVLVVMSGAAHAWSEVYVTGIGWVPLDVSPHENLDETSDPPDEDESQILGEMARSLPTLPPGPRPDYSWIWRPLGILTGSTVGSFLLMVLCLHWLVKLWRRSRPLWAGSAALPRVGYRAALDQLAEAGFIRAHGETREHFAQRCDLPSLQTLTDLHQRGQLGAPDQDPAREQSRTTWTGLLARLRVDLRGSSPWWLRWFGFFDPTSIYRSR